MKSLIKQKTDKFSNKTTTETSAVYDAGLYPAFKIIFRHISTSRIDSIVMDIEYSHTYAVAEYLNLRFGKVVLRLNNKKNYTLIPHENYTKEKNYYNILNTIDCVNVKESCWYDINPKLLKEIADASDVELKIYGGNEVNYFHEVGKDSISLQTAAQAMYDCIYHSKEYEHSINAYVGKIDDYKRTKKIHDILADYVLNIIGILGVTATILVGGVWSFFTFSWEPIKKLFLISFIIFIPVLIATLYYSIKIKEYESKNKK